MEKPNRQQHQALLAATSKPPETKLFPFLRLPAKLRIQIWKHCCPDLCEAPRLLDFIIQPCRVRGGEMTPFQAIFCGRRLAGRTRSLRCLLAVHQQSRAMALAVFPDTLSVHYNNKDVLKACDIPFHQQRDLVYLCGFAGETLPPHQEAVAAMVARYAQVTGPGNRSAVLASLRVLGTEAG